MVGVPLILLAVWFGGWPLLFLTAVIMIIGTFEMTAMLRKMQLNPPLLLLVGSIIWLLAVTAVWGANSIAFSMAVILLAMMITVVFWYPQYSFLDGAMGLLSIFYISFFVYMYLIRDLPRGWIWLVFVLLATWASDTIAYVVGRKLGKRKLAPALSPGKTVAGAIGGLCGSLAVGIIFSLIYPFLSLWFLLSLGLLVGLAAQLGDLWESAIKRTAGTKDAGKIIPGHGGVLDRFDSMFFTAPLVYYYLMLTKDIMR